MLQDKKFIWILVGVLFSGVLEILSLTGNRLPVPVAVPVLVLLIVGIGHKTILSGLQSLIALKFSRISLLMVIAVAGAFVIGQYEEAAVVIILFTLSEYLEDYGIETSRVALHSLLKLVPKTVMVKGKDAPLSIEQLRVGNIMLIKPSDIIPTDGVVVTGNTSIDESTITGEPMPVDKHTGDQIFSGTLNLQGYVEVKVTKEQKDSTIAKIIQLTFKATKEKAPSQIFIEKFSKYYTPSILLIAIGLVIVPTLFFHENFNKWLVESLSLLVIGCPCALVISTPVSIFSAIGNASKRGIVIKGGRSLEEIGQVKAVAFDKTRTLTYGRPQVTDVIPFGTVTPEYLLACAAGIESYSEHPLAKSIVEAASEQNILPHKVEGYQSIFGKGAKANCLICTDREHTIGKLQFIAEGQTVDTNILKRIESLQNEGKTVVVIASDQEVEGVIALTDEIRQESKEAIEEIKALGIIPIILTGDNHIPAKNVAMTLGIEEVYSEMLPEDKVNAIKNIQKKFGKVAMVGDGVNDAPAIVTSNVGIAMGAAGSDAAIESASIALLNDQISLIPLLIKLSRATLRTIRFNVGLAVVVKALFIMLALLGRSGLALAILADVGVTIIVILVSLRLVKFQNKKT